MPVFLIFTADESRTIYMSCLSPHPPYAANSVLVKYVEMHSFAFPLTIIQEDLPGIWSVVGITCRHGIFVAALCHHRGQVSAEKKREEEEALVVDRCMPAFNN